MLFKTFYEFIQRCCMIIQNCNFLEDFDNRLHNNIVGKIFYIFDEGVGLNV